MIAFSILATACGKPGSGELPVFPEKKVWRTVILGKLVPKYYNSPFLPIVANQLQNTIGAAADPLKAKLYFAGDLEGGAILIQATAADKKALRTFSRNIRTNPFDTITEEVTVYQMEALPELLRSLGNEKNIIFEQVTKGEAYRNLPSSAKLRKLRAENKRILSYATKYRLEGYESDILFPTNRFDFDYARIVSYRGRAALHEALFQGLALGQDRDEEVIIFHGSRITGPNFLQALRQQ